MHDELELPELQQQLLDPSTLAELISDLEHCAEDLEIRVKGRTTEHSTAPAKNDLGELVLALVEGEVGGLQVRYRYEGVWWTDTLLRAEQGVMLTRMGMPEDLA